MSDNQEIDLNRLTQRELLVILNSKVLEMNHKMDKLSGSYTDLLVRVSNIETKTKVWSGVIAFLSSLLTSIIVVLIKSKL
ncbi:MAG: hypothetical protein N4A49_01810 [Marinifilaceae bacterium]|jgi:hypothetical protein|nr:hypothetical protein [Marinifilaceae bacterium]